MRHEKAIEILQSELNRSVHLSKYPQDRHKETPQEITVLISTSEYHKAMAIKLTEAIAVLKADS